jgi:hypothetical protein
VREVSSMAEAEERPGWGHCPWEKGLKPYFWAGILYFTSQVVGFKELSLLIVADTYTLDGRLW